MEDHQTNAGDFSSNAEIEYVNMHTKSDFQSDELIDYALIEETADRVLKNRKSNCFEQREILIFSKSVWNSEEQ